MREIQYALRRLRGSPMFTIAATLTLAIAIGATASVFGLVDGVLLKAFPYRQPDRVLVLRESNPEAHLPEALVAPATFFDWRTQNKSFTALAASLVDLMQFTVNRPRDTERVFGLAVTPSYFSVLGITPVLGRTLTDDDGTPPSEVVISYGYWQRRFAGAASVLGQSLNIDNGNDQSPPPHQHMYRIVGVMPPGLAGPAQLWTRMYFAPDDYADRDEHYLNVYGRLRPGVTPEGAQREMETIAQRLAVAYPKSNAHWSARTIPLLDILVGQVRPALIMLLAAAACVLLIGAANLANLFLVRCLAREREMALRTALGATRGRLVRELLAEASILGLAAGALGVAVAVAGVRMLRALAPPTLPRLGEIGVDGRVVAFCAFTSIATVLIFGVLPAWQVSRGNLAGFLKDGGRGTGSSQQHRLQDGLVVLQVAVALVLLTGAGLLVESFTHFRRLDPGFRPEGVLTAQIAFTAERYPTFDRQRVLLSGVADQLTAQPGIQSASISTSLPGAGFLGVPPFTIVGDPAPDPAHAPTAAHIYVSPDYFPTMGITLRRGRSILPTDDSRAVKVVVVDELLARRFFGDADPLGRRLAYAVGAHTDTAEIVGVVTSVKQFGLAAENRPEFYSPFAQLSVPAIGWAYVAVHAAGDPEAKTRVLKDAVANLDPLLPVSDIETLSDRMAQSVGTTRFSSFLASLFAVIALVLGMVGIYSVLAYIVNQRQREIAVRLALGASRSHVMGDVLRHALGLTGVGLALGTAAAWLLTRALAALFEGVSPHDPSVFVGAAAAFAVVALAAASVPALRTTRVDPVTALTST
jgi:putative ABC transport system permease protein